MKTAIRFVQIIQRQLPPVGSNLLTFGGVTLTFGGVPLTFQAA
jgi:hypothetical protein